MRTSVLLAALIALPILADGLEAQRRGGRGGRNNRAAWRRPDEIKNRVGAFFTDTAAPETDGEKVAPLTTTELVRAAAAAKQPTLLYLFDGEADEKVSKNFENGVFRADAAGDELGSKLKCFHLGRIDVSKDPALKARFGEEAPLFVAFNNAGEMGKPVSMKGFKVNTKALSSALDKAGKGAVKPSLSSFAKKYTDLIRDLEKNLKETAAAEKDLAAAGGDKAKQKKADKELKALAKENEKLLEKEQQLIEKARLPERSDSAKQLGGSRVRDNRGNTGRG